MRDFDDFDEKVEDKEEMFSKFASRRRKTTFTKRFEEADESLKEKFIELRDYVASYGIKSRISIHGQTFSAHRKRYVFLTIQGKHIKAYFALDPNDYLDSPIPVIAMDSKRFEDLPVMLKVASGLSLRRAKELVDAVMERRGVKRA